MARATIGRLLEILPERIRSLRAATRSGDSQTEAEYRIAVCEIIECLLETHLIGAQGLETISMVDGFLPSTLDVSAMPNVSINGVAMWVGDEGCFLDPVAAKFELSGDGNFVNRYTLKFGDAETGLKKFPYHPHSKDIYRPPPVHWLVVID